MKFQKKLSPSHLVLKQHMRSDTVKLPLSSSQGDEISEPKLDTACASLRSQVPVTPTESIDAVENDDDLPTKSASIESTPTKLASTPARLRAETPALQPPKRCYMSPDDNATSSPNKLAMRPPSNWSLKFDTPVKNKKVEDEVPDRSGTSNDSDIHDILPMDLLQSLREKEKKAIEERDPAISQAKGW
ncbi:CDT1-like protein a, chloroplastic [Malus sylvestris]|uniref:CDT1-like protein a, chloroplastic n=1 Tax=Malus sylvestris TaxID=3752 RepID=UPI0021ACE7AD|nr:CDT1-like protein a, chloroplastic [Malus sylvestris]XP_050147199.1 CDT1-like protein a, chloroplastic [Malus sylvestris]